MDNPETMIALGTQDAGQISVRENQGPIRNVQSRDNGNTGRGPKGKKGPI
jgi:hypothetical protein